MLSIFGVTVITINCAKVNERHSFQVVTACCLNLSVTIGY